MLKSVYDQIFLFLLSFSSGLVFISSIQLQKMFILSKPPGRKMVMVIWFSSTTQKLILQVNADVQVYLCTSYQIVLLILTIANMTTAIFISCGYWMTFIFIQLIIFSFSFMIALTNISLVLQIAIILDLRIAKDTKVNN